ncbi:hypothetical protein D9M68_783070 [compost metagenome]
MPTLLCSQSPKGCASVDSPTTPLSTPIEVMPICTVDKKRVGSSPSLTASIAPRSPFSICRCRRALRAVTSAISDIANRPFSRISASNMAISIKVRALCAPGVQRDQAYHPAVTGSRHCDACVAALARQGPTGNCRYYLPGSRPLRQAML